MSLRAMNIAELNRILFMIRNTLKKEKELNELRWKANVLKKQINDLYKVIPKKNEFISHPDAKEYIEEIRRYKKKIKEIKQSIDNENDKYKAFAENIKFYMTTYHVKGGLLNKSEYDENFIYEYAYLIQKTDLKLFSISFYEIGPRKKRKRIRDVIRKYLK